MKSMKWLQLQAAIAFDTGKIRKNTYRIVMISLIDLKFSHITLNLSLQ